MRIFFVASLLFTISAGISWAGGTGVGNAGLGVARANRVYLLDLVEAKVETRAWLGHPGLVPLRDRRMEALAQTLNVPVALFERKILDMNDMRPMMGTYVREAVLNHTWRLSKGTLETTNDAITTYREWTSENGLLQLAIRFRETIRVNEAAWLKMDEPNRVALLIHEGLSALKKVQCSRDRIADTCLTGWTKPEELRKMVASIFIESPSARPGPMSEIGEHLKIPTENIQCPNSHPGAVATSKSEGTRTSLTVPEDELKRSEWIQSTCEKAKSRPQKLTLIRRPYMFQREKAESRSAQDQTNIVLVPPLLETELKDSKDCEASLSQLLKTWFETPIYNQEKTCKISL